MTEDEIQNAMTEGLEALGEYEKTIFCIDPSSVSTGWAIMGRKKGADKCNIIKTGLISTKQPKGEKVTLARQKDMACKLHEMLSSKIDCGALVSEEIWVELSASRMPKVTGALYFLAGAIHNSCDGDNVHFVRQSEWTRNVPKPKRISQVYDYFVDIPFPADIKEKQKEDVLDAIGIGMHILDGYNFNKQRCE